MALADEPIRIDCGASADHDGDGIQWSRDRFAARGESRPREEGAGDGPHGTVRLGTRRPGESAPLYRIPLAEGFYTIDLHLVTESPMPVDVLLGGSKAFTARDLRPGDAPLTAVVGVTDGRLEVDLSPLTRATPRIAAFEIERLSPEEFQERARAWTERSGWREAFPVAQLARATEHLGDLPEALDLFEQAALLPGFGAADAEKLAALRDDLLPELLSYATADDLVERRPDEAPRILAAVQEHVRSRRATQPGRGARRQQERLGALLRGAHPPGSGPSRRRDHRLRGAGLLRSQGARTGPCGWPSA